MATAFLFVCATVVAAAVAQANGRLLGMNQDGQLIQIDTRTGAPSVLAPALDGLEAFQLTGVIDFWCDSDNPR